MEILPFLQQMQPLETSIHANQASSMASLQPLKCQPQAFASTPQYSRNPKMASSSSSSPHSNIYTVTQEEFNVFHTIDRTLFARMVFTLGRDADESVRVMGLWLWLEQNGEEFNLVYKMLSLPDALVDALSDEAVMALACIENDKFPFEPESAAVDIPLIQHVSKTPVSLRFFHENRLRILRGVTKICSDICHRAFQDILQTLETQRVLSRPTVAVPAPLGGRGSYLGTPASQFVPAAFPSSQAFGFVGVRGESSQVPPAPAVAIPNIRAEHRQVILNSEMSDLFSRLQLKSGKEEDGEAVPPDERTIFLTFSKGYPISEDEVRDYFARRYGNFIESIHMQEVQPPEQPLYARLVVKTESSIDLVLEARSKAKFSINGKHVWARKYVRKNSARSPLRPSPPPTPPPSPPLQGIRPFNFLPLPAP